ncbi:hypothetical protein [Paenibacillus illinoisensis]|uniref:hypothetical protein n=1 Tax=Paenibacillus illinoisensis TaxID=59845 RepID=UPI003017176C
MISTIKIIQVTLVTGIIVAIAGCTTSNTNVENSFIENKELEIPMQETNPNRQTIYSKQKEVQVTLPSEWKTGDEPNSISLVHAVSSDGSKTLNMSRYKRSDLSSKINLTDYIGIQQEIKNTSTDSPKKKERLLRTSEVTIDGYSSYVKETERDYDSSQIGYITAYFESKHHFYTISLESNGGLTEEDRILFEETAKHVRIYHDEPTDTLTVESTLELIDHSLDESASQISLPSSWTVDPQYSKEQEFKFSGFLNTFDNESVMIARYPKSFGTTLTKFYSSMVKSSIEPYSLKPLPAPASVEINGFKGFQLENYSEATKLKIGELYTFLDTPKDFVIIIFTSKASRFERVKSDYIKYTQTYREMPLK